VEKGLNCLKLGKASDCDDVSKESIMYSHPVIIIHMKLLFSMICEHGYVPDRFGRGITVPVVKDRLGDLSCASNFRPITLSPIISKIFEYCILHKYEHLLQSDDLQLGFKKNSSCSHALFALTATVEHFITHGSNVYMASLDATKAFDRVHHVKLFQKLIYKGWNYQNSCCLVWKKQSLL